MPGTEGFAGNGLKHNVLFGICGRRSPPGFRKPETGCGADSIRSGDEKRQIERIKNIFFIFFFRTSRLTGGARRGTKGMKHKTT